MPHCFLSLALELFEEADVQHLAAGQGLVDLLDGLAQVMDALVENAGDFFGLGGRLPITAVRATTTTSASMCKPSSSG